VAEKEKKEEKKAKKPQHKETPSETVASFAATFVVGLFIITFIMQLFTIPSGSMEQTLLIGDYVFVDRLTPTAKAGYVGPLIPYREVHRGDIIVFLKPNQPGLHLVKRIVGIPGDRLHLENGVLYRNGERLNEPYVSHTSGDHVGYRDEFPAVPLPYGIDSNAPDWPWPQEVHQYIQGGDLVVPPDNYFGMGDNRDRSLDSRYWGFVERSAIMGRPFLIYWSVEANSADYGPTTFWQRLTAIFETLFHLPTRTRWGRMLHTVH